jgi:transcription elongation factor Elf1
MRFRLLSVLEEVLGSSESAGKSDIVFHCPFCNHHKKKLSVNLTNQKYHCWICETKGRSISNLFYKYGATKNQIDQLRNVLEYYQMKDDTKEDIPNTLLKLPDEYISLDKVPHKSVLNFLKRFKHSFTTQDIVRHKVGYCLTGKYAGRIILPSYDKNGTLNFFEGRDFTGLSPYKYLGAPVKINDIIVNEFFLDFKFPIVIVEGFFDSVSVKRNVTYLTGSIISEKLKHRLLMEETPLVYIAIDPDKKKQAIKYCLELGAIGIPTKLVDLGTKDPSDLGYDDTWHAIEGAVEINEYSAITNLL